MRRLAKIAWRFSVLCSLLAAAFGVADLGAANGAPQQAVALTMALALAIIPYVLARALDELSKP